MFVKRPILKINKLSRNEGTSYKWQLQKLERKINNVHIFF